MVHPDYQNRGLGSQLTIHCNELADEAGAKNWIVSRTSTLNCFQRFGFTVVGKVGQDLRKFGGSPDDSCLWVLRRHSRLDI